MTTVPNDDVKYQDAPKIEVAGQKWPVPLLAPRQNRLVIPKLMSLRSLQMAKDITTEQYDDLTEIVYQALTRAHPSLKREDFLDWPIPTSDLLNAFPIIAQQTGMVQTAKGTPQPGEGNPQTGTE